VQTLLEHVERDGPLKVRDGIGWLARAATTIGALHAEGRVHGRIGPRAILIAAADCHANGALREPSALEDEPLYHCPDRVDDDQPSVYDDVWALTATLYWVLTSSHPYPGGVEAHRRNGRLRPPTPIATHRGDLDVLQRLVDRVMIARHPLPAQTVDQLMDELRELSPAVDTLPPLEMEAALPATLSRVRGFRFHALALAGLAAALAAVVWWRLHSATSSDPPLEQPMVPPVDRTVAPTHAARTAAPSSTPVPTAVASSVEAEDLVACTAGLFAADAFEKQRVAVDFPCRERSPTKGVVQLSRAILRGANGRSTNALSEWGQLGWYRLAALAMARAACCQDPPALVLPASIARCRLGEALDELTSAARGSDRSLIVAVEQLSRAFECAHQMDTGPMFGLEGPPNAGQMALFLRALSRMRSAPR
jgi:hypothetical protein